MIGLELLQTGGGFPHLEPEIPPKSQKTDTIVQSTSTYCPYRLLCKLFNHELCRFSSEFFESH